MFISRIIKITDSNNDVYYYAQVATTKLFWIWPNWKYASEMGNLFSCNKEKHKTLEKANLAIKNYKIHNAYIVKEEII